MDKITVTGMVISATPIGDFDKRIVLLTKERGKIAAFAKGARRPKSTLMAGTRPFTFGEFEIYEGRTSYNVMSVNVKNYFDELSRDVEGACYGFYFLELADYYGRENVDGSETLNLLYQSFRALLKHNIKNTLIRRIFELKIMTINGEYPEMFKCIGCGKENERFFYSIPSAGLVCTTCMEKRSGIRDINVSTIYTFQYVISTGIEKLYTFDVSDDVLREFSDIMNRHMQICIDGEFKSVELIDGISWLK